MRLLPTDTRKAVIVNYVFDDFALFALLAFISTVLLCPGGVISLLINFALVWWLANTLKENWASYFSENYFMDIDHNTRGTDDEFFNLTPSEFDFMV